MFILYNGAGSERYWFIWTDSSYSRITSCGNSCFIHISPGFHGHCHLVLTPALGDVEGWPQLQTTRRSDQGPYSLSGKTSYRQNLRRLEATRLDVVMIVSFWNLTVYIYITFHLQVIYIHTYIYIYKTFHLQVMKWMPGISNKVRLCHNEDCLNEHKTSLC